MSAELESLTAEAAAVDEQIAPPIEQPEAAQPQPAAANEQAEIAGLITIMAGLFAPVFPSLQKIYTKETVDSIAAAAVPVMAKHGWTTGALLGRYAEELALAAVAFPVGVATWQGIRADAAAAKAKDKAEPAKAITHEPDNLSASVPGAPDPATFAQRG